MAIFIRTGANGSYKSAYVVWFTILEALKAGRVVVTNIEGMEPLAVIAQRLDIEFPSTTRLIRIFSRDQDGIELWQHFFCWCPLGALIVIDECQDIFSKNVGFRMDKVMYRPLEEFLDKLPPDYESFFYSRYTPADMSNLDAGEVDDRGRAEYDEQGRIIYPLSFNEGFQRHRKYNWDIHLLSPDWGQIQSEIRAPSEECYFHKGRDAYFWAKRKPYIYKHQKNVSTPTIPKGKDPNLTKQKIPLEAFLLYKSTSTGIARDSGAMNMLFRSPKIMGVTVLGLLCMGYFIYALSNLVFGSSETVANTTTQSTEVAGSDSASGVSAQGARVDPTVSPGGNGNTTAFVSSRPSTRLDDIKEMLGLYDIQALYYTGYTTKQDENGFYFYVTLEATTPEGTYYLNDRFLKANQIAYVHYDDCLLKLTKGALSLNVYCKPTVREDVEERKPEMANVQLGPSF
ncbi:toxin [Vibrio vulnificus]|nr:toxin [Vibrio vulnificus]